MVRLSGKGRRVGIPDGRGGTAEHTWNDLSPQVRKRLFGEGPQGLEPLWLWLNEDGMPRDAYGWHHTFDAANARIVGLGLEHFSRTAHMHRRSFALKWFSVAELVFAQRLGHLSQEEMRDFREQFGDHWHLVQTMLGHRRVETRKEVCLEPFRNLQVELLLAHADGYVDSRKDKVARAGDELTDLKRLLKPGPAGAGWEDDHSPGRTRRRTEGAQTPKTDGPTPPQIMLMQPNHCCNLFAIEA
ncbi:hypothetical protein [Streptomyces sp. LaPpAH-108]|uniref:hypothetical protein n=1 Tax=Streptomyces sp. LaPpAH-108 TaxID=1155714 RepID=UPI0006863DF9|nr:hypothetical protein [Streptomyces sp. LaPpAH-108]